MTDPLPTGSNLGWTRFAGCFEVQRAPRFWATCDTPCSSINPGLGDRSLHACSSAKVSTAFADPELQNEILDNTFERFNASTHLCAQALLDEFKKIIECGYAVCEQEIQLGVSSVAAPVKLREIGATFSVGAVVLSSRYESNTLRDMGGYLCALASESESVIQVCNVGNGS